MGTEREEAALALQQAISRHRAGAGRLVLDVNWRPTFWGLAADAEPTAEIQQQMQPLLRQADLLKLAAEEAEGLFSSRDPQAVAAALPQRPAVVVTDGSAPVSAGTVRDGVRETSANFKVPKHVFLVDELPRNTMGKVRKDLLRRRFAGQAPS
mgnify:CR=1 FL=1